MASIKKSAFEWMQDSRIQDDPAREVIIIDPDGWRRSDGVSMEDPITWDDFYDRFAQSTILTQKK